MAESKPAPTECANCGASIPRSAKACPECGADERTGWRDQSLYDGLDLPETAWPDDTESGKPAPASTRVNGVPWYWWLVGAILLALFIGGALGVR